ncbi:uncharacterized protein LOC120600173 isoform X2 [Pteropus medius]|uniref:uncharacterized protein LOC120600173 isoform X2 n=2 Tax=Pteropus vampyrus TaxID=132908 RepID=UPI00196B63CA|nr:uncharacterized protein LOC120600173 isoform X2 [Pteropus giganteus]
MISTLRPLPLCPTLNEHPPTLPLHLGNLPHDFQGPVGCISNSGPRQQNCTVLKSCQPFLHSRSRRQLATYAGPPRLAPESATAPAVPPPQGRVGQAGAVSLDTCCTSSRPDFWKADFPRSTLNFTPFYLLDLELDLWDDLHHDPFPGFAPAVCCMIPVVVIFQIQMVRVSCLAAGVRADVREAEGDQGQRRGCGMWTANSKEHMSKARLQPIPQTSPGACKICWAHSLRGAGRQPWRGRPRSPVAHMTPSALEAITFFSFVTQL